MSGKKDKIMCSTSIESVDGKAKTSLESNVMEGEACKKALDNDQITSEDLLCQTLNDDNLFENYINLHHRYPSNYTGGKNEDMLEKMRQDLFFDEKEQILYVPYGRMIKGTFIYFGERKRILGY